MKIRYVFILIGIIAILFSGCKKDQPDSDYIPKGTIMGRVVAENGSTPLPSVKVFVDYKGEIYLTYTNSQGYFILEAPAGKQTLHIQSGKGRIFRSTLEVDVKEKGVVTIPGGSIKLSQVANLAYIPGAYDNIQTILIDSLGYTATQLQISDLDNLSTLEQFSAIFLNCGKPGTLTAQHYNNLQQFVLNGGSLYVSDWAVEYLIGDNALLSKIDRYKLSSQVVTNQKSCVPRTGGFIDESELCTMKEGPYTTLTNVQIIPQEIQVYVGKTTVDIEYDLGAWEVIKTLSSDWEVLLQDNNNGFGPLAVRRNFNPSNKALQNQLEQGWITICHIPPGNPNNPITITISINAWPAHQAHGDYIGACVGTGGQILFTTFHNHPYGHGSSDIVKFMEYFIINL